MPCPSLHCREIPRLLPVLSWALPEASRLASVTLSPHREAQMVVALQFELNNGSTSQ